MRASIASAFALVGLVACTAPTSPSNENAASSDEALSSKATSFVTFTSRGAKKGYQLQDVNKSSSYSAAVTEIDYTSAGLDRTTIQALEAAPTNELVLEGQLAKGGQSFVVTTAYRGMPGVTFDAKATTFYALDAQKECLRAPCYQTASSLNGSATAPKASYLSLDTTAAAKPLVSTDWLAREATVHSAIVVGTINARTQVLAASQVFVALPHVAGPCVATSLICPDASPVHTYTRTSDMCIEATGCATAGLCPKYLPGCAPGYTLQTWTSQPNGCPAFACDPSFLH